MSDSRRLEVGTVYRDSFNLLFDNISIHIANTFIAIIATILLSITILGLLAVPAVWGGYSHAMIRMSKGEKVDIDQSGLSKREWNELMEAFDLKGKLI